MRAYVHADPLIRQENTSLPIFNAQSVASCKLSNTESDAKARAKCPSLGELSVRCHITWYFKPQPQTPYEHWRNVQFCIRPKVLYNTIISQLQCFHANKALVVMTIRNNHCGLHESKSKIKYQYRVTFSSINSLSLN